MKKLLTTVALAALVATPALAQTRDRAQHRTRVVTPQAYATPDQQHRHSTNAINDVYSVHGWYVGSDPDPTIRSQLANDPTQAD